MPAETEQSSQASVSRRQSFLTRNPKQKEHPPVPFRNQESRRQHARSSSFGGFVSRIFPSRREERGHTLRAQFRDDGSQDATDLVFGNTETLEMDKFNRSVSDSALAKGRQSGSPLLFTGLHAPPSSPHRARPHGPGNTRKASPRVGRGGQKPTPLARLLGLQKELDPEGAHSKDPYTTARQAQTSKTIQIPVLNVEKKPPLDVDVELSKAKRLFEEKKARRTQRRSLRESGDFLGVQGANPRTGYWDVSTGTSSSDPSQLSEQTKQRLDQEAKEVEEQKRKLAEAQLKHQLELQGLKALKDQRIVEKAKKAEQKKLEIRARRMRHGKWRHSENGWSSVAEPNLSPIVQSLAGSLTRGEFKFTSF